MKNLLSRKSKLVVLLTVIVIILSFSFASILYLQIQLQPKVGEKEKIKGIEAEKIDETLEELKVVAEQSPEVKNYTDVKPSYKKLSEQDIQSFIAASLIPPNISSKTEIYMVDYIKQHLTTGISLIVDLENEEILKTQHIIIIGGEKVRYVSS